MPKILKNFVNKFTGCKIAGQRPGTFEKKNKNLEINKSGF